jgi:hypothetical protein
MFSFANLFGLILFGAIGLGGVSFGRRSGLLSPIFFGIALMLYPYFIAQTWLRYAVGIMLTVLLVRHRDS